MSDLPRRVEAVRDLVDARWSDARAEKVEASLARRGNKRDRSRRVLVSFATVCILSVVGGLGWASLRRQRASTPLSSPASSAAPAATSHPGAGAGVPAGSADPAPVPETASSSGALSPPDSPSEPASSTIAASAPRNPALAPSGAWRRWAHDGDYDSAFKSLEAAGPTAVKDDTGDLLLASDVARLSGHAARAVDPLRRVLRDHATDPRAPLAAFTLGRVLLDELGRPDEAAGAFSQARRLAPGGPLEEDALAREVEALSRAGETDRAREAAAVYVERYPSGRRLRSVRRFGGID
jgi:transmembrane sensor